jgi:serine/threonine-protein kinase
MSPPVSPDDSAPEGDEKTIDTHGPIGSGRAASADEVPTQAGPYAIEGEVARGGNGIVLRAFDPAFRRHIAVKVLQARYRGNGDVERRFLAEARLTGQLQHPGVPPAYHIGQLDDGSPFFALKLVEGRTLRDLLAERRDTTEALAHNLELFEQVCQAVAYAHSKGVIHRDLKPSNIMVGRFGEVLVMDWGLAKFVPRNRAPANELGESAEDEVEPGTLPVAGPGSAQVKSQMGTTFGTPSYMAPEQARGAVNRLDERTDVFGLGALLCEILTGKPPFDGPREQVRMQARLGHLAPAYQRLEASAADSPLVALARACLAATPQDRPADAGEVARAVADYRAHLEETLRDVVLRRSAGTVASGRQPSAWRFVVLLLVALLGLVLAGVGALLWSQK